MVCQTCAEGHHPWNQANEQPEYQEHQDNFEEAFVVTNFTTFSYETWH